MYFLNKKRGKGFKEFVEIILTRISFSEKAQILKRITSIENKDVKMLEIINSLRNGFVHGCSIRENRFSYKGKK